MKARDVMTTDLVTVYPDAEVIEVARRMIEHRISAVPVVEPDGTLVGIVSEGDLLRRYELGTERRLSFWVRLLEGDEAVAREFVRSHGRRARDIMSTSLVTVDEDATLPRMARMMEERRIKRVIVVRDGRPVGIVSRADLVRGLTAAAAEDTAATDGDIRTRILKALRDQGLSVGQASVTVKDGVVHLWGTVPSETQRQALRVAAETTAGVTAIEDHMMTVPERGWAS